MSADGVATRQSSTGWRPSCRVFGVSCGAQALGFGSPGLAYPLLHDPLPGPCRGSHRPPSRQCGGAPRHLTPLIERTFRYAYMMATKMRAEMLAAGRGEELEAQIADARALQDDLLEIKRAEGSVEERGSTSS